MCLQPSASVSTDGSDAACWMNKKPIAFDDGIGVLLVVELPSAMDDLQ